MTAKKGRPPTDTQPVMIRMTPEMIAALDDARRNVSDLPTRPELVRRVMTDWLRQQGYLPEDEGGA
jgi:hypothetical protein